MGKPAKRGRSAAPASLGEQLKAIFKAEHASPTTKLIYASTQWDDGPASSDYFQMVKSFVEGLDSSPEGEDELVALYNEYATKSDADLIAELQELRSGGVISKRHVKILKAASEGERRRQL